MLRKVVALVALCLIPFSASAVAHAESVSSLTLIDERGDMWVVGPEEGPPVAAPRQRRGDIRRTIIRHGAHAVTVRTRFSELSRKPQGHFLVVVLRTNTGVLRDVYIVAGQFSRPPDWRGYVVVERRNGRPVDCAAAHNINYTTNVMRLRVPRSCLQDPRWVQAKVFYTGVYGKGGTFALKEHFDNAHNAGSQATGWTRHIAHR
jgi:hypothetical protein